MKCWNECIKNCCREKIVIKYVPPPDYDSIDQTPININKKYLASAPPAFISPNQQVMNSDEGRTKE